MAEIAWETPPAPVLADVVMNGASGAERVMAGFNGGHITRAARAGPAGKRGQRSDRTVLPLAKRFRVTPVASDATGLSSFLAGSQEGRCHGPVTGVMRLP